MCVHTRHCCFKHGCKYGDEDCPVATGEEKQEYKCESCNWESDEIQPVLDLLNQAFKSDPNAIYSIMTNRVPCNEKLADDLHIIVNQTNVSPLGNFTVSGIGLIAGILSCLNLPLVALKYSDRGELLGFCEYEDNNA
jgi:hypothetical protein